MKREQSIVEWTMGWMDEWRDARYSDQGAGSTACGVDLCSCWAGGSHRIVSRVSGGVGVGARITASGHAGVRRRGIPL